METAVGLATRDQGDTRSSGRMAQGITHDIFDGPMQQFRIGRQNRHVARSVIQSHLPPLALEHGVLGDRFEQLSHIDRFDPPGDAGLQAGQGQQFADQPIHPLPLALDPLQAVLQTLRLLPGQADRCLKSGQRRTHLVRNIVQQALLPGHRGLETLGHAVEIIPQIGQLVAAATHGLGHPHAQIAFGN